MIRSPWPWVLAFAVLTGCGNPPPAGGPDAAPSSKDASLPSDGSTAAPPDASSLSPDAAVGGSDASTGETDGSTGESDASTFQADASTTGVDASPDAPDASSAKGRLSLQIVSGGGRVSGGTMTLDVQLGHPLKQQPIQNGARTLEGGAAVKP